MAQVKSYRYAVVDVFFGGEPTSGIPRRVRIRRNDDAEDRQGAELGGNRLRASSNTQRFDGSNPSTSPFGAH